MINDKHQDDMQSRTKQGEVWTHDSNDNKLMTNTNGHNDNMIWWFSV